MKQLKKFDSNCTFITNIKYNNNNLGKNKNDVPI